MRAVSVRCPECNAALEVGAEAREATCTYCGALTVIQRRTRFLQRPEPLPARPPEAPPARVATEGRSASRSVGVAAIVLIPLALFVGLPVLLCNLDWSVPYGVTVLADVDGDGAEDLIALMRERESEAMHLAAFAGQSGARLWRSDELRRGSTLGLLCVAGEVVIDGDEGAVLNGINVADGELRWRVRLEEAVERLCAGGDASTVRVERKDKRAQLLSLSDGTLRPAAASPTCAPLRCDRPFGRGGRRVDDTRERWQAALPGMHVELLVDRGQTTLALGYKTPGTRVPMIAAVRTGEGGPRVLWRAVVPAGDPLGAEAGALHPEQVAVRGDTVAVNYELSDNSTNRLTVFSLADGKRRWDLGLPPAQHGIWSVLITGRLVVVTSTWGLTTALDAQSGEQVYTID